MADGRPPSSDWTSTVSRRNERRNYAYTAAFWLGGTHLPHPEPGQRLGTKERSLVETCAHLRNLSAQLPGFQRRRNRRPERHPPAARLFEEPRCGRNLAKPDLPLAPSRLWLRCFQLRSDRPAIRHHG